MGLGIKLQSYGLRVPRSGLAIKQRNDLAAHAADLAKGHTGPHFRSMKITQEVREFAAQQGVDESAFSKGKAAESAAFFALPNTILYNANSIPTCYPCTLFQTSRR